MQHVHYVYYILFSYIFVHRESVGFINSYISGQRRNTERFKYNWPIANHNKTKREARESWGVG